MNVPPPPAAPPAFRDRSGALLAWGWGLIALAVVAVLAALLPLALLVIPAGGSASSPYAGAVRPILMSAALYLGVAAAFVTLGVGSIRARRWARALTVTLAWLWLVTGVLTIAFLALLVPAMGRIPTCGIVGMVAIVFVFFVVLPLVLLLFYGREDVRRTVAARNPAADWTDGLPGSLLGLVVALGFGAVAALLSMFSTPAVPLFGRVVTGPGAVAFMLGTAAVSVLLVLGVVRRSPAAWWGLIAFHVVTLGNLVTFRRVPFRELLTKMGYPPEQVEMAARFNIVGTPAFFALMIALWVAVLLYLLSVRRHLKRADGRTD